MLSYDKLTTGKHLPVKQLSGVVATAAAGSRVSLWHHPHRWQCSGDQRGTMLQQSPLCHDPPAHGASCVVLSPATIRVVRLDGLLLSHTPFYVLQCVPMLVRATKLALLQFCKRGTRWKHGSSSLCGAYVQGAGSKPAGQRPLQTDLEVQQATEQCTMETWEYVRC